MASQNRLQSGLQDFQGAILVNLDKAIDTLQLMGKIFNHKDELKHSQLTQKVGIPVYDLNLNNKYYETTVNFFDHIQLNETADELSKHILQQTEAIVIHANGENVTQGQLDSSVQKLEAVVGEPRILLYHSIDEDCESFKSLQEWCIENKFDFIEFDPDDNTEFINSLSAYKWSKLRMRGQPYKNSSEVDQSGDDPLKQIQEFDDLLKQINAFKDSPEDKKLMDIAEKLSMLLGESEMDDLINNSGVDNKISGNTNQKS